MESLLPSENDVINSNDDSKKYKFKKISSNIKNKGNGAGGKNTNKNGLPYESLTELSSELNVITTKSYSSVIAFRINPDIHFISAKQSNLFKCMSNKIDSNVSKAHGCKNPDECFINEYTNTIFIIEKKFQQVSGSVCEKIQTSDFKLWQYSRTFPKYKIIYIYCLSNWFKENCKAELEYLKVKQIPVFWGGSESYKRDIINYIVNHD